VAGKSTTLTVKILTDASQAASGTKQAASTYQKFESGINSMVPAAGAVTAALALAGKGAADAASRTEQAMGGLDSVFGKNASIVKGWAASAADAVGLSTSAYSELATVAGAQLKNLGLSQEDALSGTKDMIALGADLAATFGGTTTDAVNALSSALRGEADPAERYGLSLNQTAVNAKLAEKGMDKLTGTALQQAKAQTILELATTQAGDSVGQFGREADTSAGQQQRANAQWENAVSILGTALLPIVTTITKQFAAFAKWIGQNSTLVLTLAGVLGGIALTILTLSAAMKAWTIIQAAWAAATKIAAAVQLAWNAAMAANPIGLIILAVVALVAAFIWLWNNVEGFRNFFIAAWDWIVKAVGATGKFIAGVWKAIVAGAKSAWDAVIGAVKSAVDFVLRVMAVQRQMILAVWNAIVAGAKAAWNGVVGAVRAAVNWIAGAVRNVGNVINVIWQSILNAARNVWNGIVSSVRSAIDWIVGAVRNVGSFVNSIWQSILNAGAAVWNTLVNVVSGAMNAIMAPVRWLQDAFNGVVSAIQDVINWISRIAIPDLSALNPFKSAAPQSAAAYSGVAGYAGGARALRAPSPMSSGVAAAGGITIVIQGGLDSKDAIARTVKNVLVGRQRRTGGVVLERRTK
jgi:phage-related protein